MCAFGSMHLAPFATHIVRRLFAFCGLQCGMLLPLFFACLTVSVIPSESIFADEGSAFDFGFRALAASGGISNQRTEFDLADAE